jgi:hypothetical protein
VVRTPAVDAICRDVRRRNGLRDASPSGLGWHKPPGNISKILEMSDVGEISESQAIKEIIAKGYSAEEAKAWVKS